MAPHGNFLKHNCFTKYLALLIELTSGLPTRGTELVWLQHTNMLTAQRNLFIGDGYFVTVLASKKGTGPLKLIPQFLPHAVGKLILYYFMDAVPSVHLLHSTVLGPQEPSAILLVNHKGQLWETNVISKELKALCQEFAGPAARIQFCRIHPWSPTGVILPPGHHSDSNVQDCN